MKKLFFITALSILIFIFVAFFSIQLTNQKSAPYEENIKENITKVTTTEPDIKILTQTFDVTEAAEMENDAPLVFSYPVSGEIGLSHSPDTLIYSKTLKEWTTHNGIDIQAKRGTPVFAAEAGTIDSITETPGMGIEIVISHKDGYKTIYSNLSAKEMVKVGQRVEKGQVISGIGNTSSFEYYEPEHLHFEIYKDNKPLDPQKILFGD